jgi:hypothetical protein
MPFVVFVAFCDPDNDLQTFTRVYSKYDGTPMEDVYRQANGIDPEDEVSGEDVDEWEGALCQGPISHVFEIPVGDTYQPLFTTHGEEWRLVTPA